MNWEAFFAIGAFMGLVGLILVPLGLWVGRRIARKTARKGSMLVITRIGYLYFGAFVALLLLGLTVSTIAKGTWLERTLGGQAVTIVYYGFLVFASILLEHYFKRRGIQITRRQKRVDA
jgi:amino acid transporter